MSARSAGTVAVLQQLSDTGPKPLEALLLWRSSSLLLTMRPVQGSILAHAAC